MMTLNKALSLARESVARLTGCPRGDLLLGAPTQCRRMGWIFFFVSHAAAGEQRLRPVVVTHRGAVHHLDGALPLEQSLGDLEWAERRQALLGPPPGCGHPSR